MIQSAIVYLDSSLSSGLKTPWQMSAGLPWLTRWIMSASKSGVENFYVIGEKSLESTRSRIEPTIRKSNIRISWIHGSQVEILRKILENLKSTHAKLWIVSHWNVFIPKRSWQMLQETLEPTGLSDVLGIFGAVLRTEDLIALDSRIGNADQFFGEVGQRVPHRAPETLGMLRRLSKTNDLKSVERQLYQELIKETEGFMSKYIERRISFIMTRFLVKTSVTPNTITVVNTLIGLGAAYLLSIPQKTIQVYGALLFLFTSILDGCDGEVARLKFMESKWGGWLDFLGDNLVHIAVFWGIALGVFASGSGHTAITLGALAVGGTLSSSLFVFFKSLRDKTKASDPFFTSVTHLNGQEPSVLEKIDDFLTRRDFIYLVLILSAFGKLEWFLWMSAIGAPLFFATLLVIHLTEPSPGEKIA